MKGHNKYMAKQREKIEMYQNALNKCENLNNFGNGCYEFCAYRENGCCELSKEEIIRLCLEELLDIKLSHSIVSPESLRLIIEKTLEKGEEEEDE
jgi:hypothetical protein